MPRSSFRSARVASPARAERNKLALNSLLRYWQLYLLLLPAIVFFSIFSYAPMYGLQIAFRDFIPSRGISSSRWIGLDNFERLFNSFYFVRLLTNTLRLSLYQLLLFPLPIVFSLILNEIRMRRLKSIVQTVTYAPHFVSLVVVVGMLGAFLDPRTGLVTNTLRAMRLDAPQFMQSPDWFPHLYVWSGAWQHLGWSTIIYLAALAGVSSELLQAAEVDGASRLQRITHVHLPAIMPVIVIVFILEFGSFMSVGFEKVLLMNNSLNSSTSDIIQTFVYQTGLLQGQYSYGAAVGLFDSIINVALLVSANALAKRFSETSLW